MKKTANLKKRFDELREEPEPPVEVILRLDAELHRVLRQLAAQEHLSLEAYIAHLLSGHMKTTIGEEVGWCAGKIDFLPESK